jgi:hypothetical protein
MKINRIVFIVLAAVIAAGFVATFMTPSTQTQNKAGQTKTEEEIPIVDIYAPEPDDPATKEFQRNRGKKYDTGVPLEDDFEPDLNLTEIPSAHAAAEPALPAAQSDLVAIGTVTDSKAFLSNDRTNVYSEFTLRIEKTLKNISPLTLAAGSEITTERAGGRVRFSSGNILRRDILGRGFPQKQTRYLLFLKWSEPGKDFLILTGYKLQNGRANPLDGRGASDTIYKNYASYENKRENEFIKSVKDALKASSGEVQKIK